MADDDAFNGEIAALRRLVDVAGHIVALTGAGISTESGIPDFRSPGGLWTRVKPITRNRSEAAAISAARRSAASGTGSPNETMAALTRPPQAQRGETPVASIWPRTSASDISAPQSRQRPCVELPWISISSSGGRPAR